MSERRRLLWTDNDGPMRFRNTQWELEDAGWEIDWALDLRSAARKLADEVYDAVILDQSLPFDSEGETPRYWGGCMLLFWLRQSALPQDAPALEARKQKLLAGHIPRAENRKITAVLVSSYYVEEVKEATRHASEQDRDISLLPKPVDAEELRRLLEKPTLEKPTLEKP